MSPEPGQMDEHNHPMGHHRHPWAMLDAHAAHAGAYALHLTHAAQQMPQEQSNTGASPDSIKNEVKLEPGIEFGGQQTGVPAATTPPSSTPSGQTSQATPVSSSSATTEQHYQQWMTHYSTMAYQQPYSHGHHHHPHHQPQIEVAQHHAIGFA